MTAGSTMDKEKSSRIDFLCRKRGPRNDVGFLSKAVIGGDFMRILATLGKSILPLALAQEPEKFGPANGIPCAK